ncbi:hypothetical protein M885DRAFT_627283 [Pelagophyceae sp. CCMP2097]|nr:hypothetical protein M885DRAFT_627283 [Pelagophyceae sp. CCMP2097]
MLEADAPAHTAGATAPGAPMDDAPAASKRARENGAMSVQQIYKAAHWKQPKHPAERAGAAAADAVRLCATQARRDITLARLQVSIVGQKTHELILGWTPDAEARAPYTEAQILKVALQASLDGLDLDSCAAAALHGTPYCDSYQPSTLVAWYRDYRANDAFFTPDRRGSYKRDTLTTFVIDNEDILADFKAWLKANLAVMTVSKATVYLMEEVVGKMSDSDKKTYKISEAEPGRAAVYGLMTHKSVGCLFHAHKKCFYVDAHEREDVRIDRAHYCTLFFEFELRMYKWIQLSLEDATTLRGKYPNMSPGYAYTAHDGAAMVEFHVDDCEDFIKWRVGEVEESSILAKCKVTFMGGLCMGGNLSVRFPTGARPMMHIGQDEACYKAYLLPKECWTIDGYSPLRPKEEGPSLMLSAFVGQCFFLGLPCPESVIDQVRRRGGVQVPHWDIVGR